MNIIGDAYFPQYFLLTTVVLIKAMDGLLHAYYFRCLLNDAIGTILSVS
jgi:hypothetical protein